MRATRRAGPDSAARLRALTRRAYTATAGHLDLEEEAGREFDRIVEGPAPPDAGAHRAPPARRWAVSGRAVLVVLLTVAALAGVVVGRSVLLGPGDAVPVPRLTEETPSSAGEPPLPADAAPTTGPPATAQAPAPTEGAAATPAPVVVHVAGAVAEAGLRTLPPGARVGDAVTAAGGALAEAELAAVNLARPLVDGEQVYVPRVGEAPPGAPAGGAPAPGDTGEGAAPAEAVVDLNTADLAALDTLPGVGPAIAQRILDWRDANGPFHSVDELLEVPGIGPATLERLRPKVRV